MNDDQWREAVKLRDHHACRRCRRRYVRGDGDLHAHHIFTRSRDLTRTDILNGITLCGRCHRWWHAYPFAARTWIEQDLGVDVVEALERQSRRLVKREAIT